MRTNQISLQGWRATRNWATQLHPKVLGYAVLLVEVSAHAAQEERNRGGAKAPNFLAICNIVNIMVMMS